MMSYYGHLHKKDWPNPFISCSAYDVILWTFIQKNDWPNPFISCCTKEVDHLGGSSNNHVYNGYVHYITKRKQLDADDQKCRKIASDKQDLMEWKFMEGAAHEYSHSALSLFWIIGNRNAQQRASDTDVWVKESVPSLPASPTCVGIQQSAVIRPLHARSCSWKIIDCRSWSRE